jgi:hypothetical protein
MTIAIAAIPHDCLLMEGTLQHCPDQVYSLLLADQHLLSPPQVHSYVTESQCPTTVTCCVITCCVIDALELTLFAGPYTSPCSCSARRMGDRERGAFDEPRSGRERN